MTFTGQKDAFDVYPELDCLLLSSISEAQPLVILEANCAGIPVISTDVGSCIELLNGRHELDRLLGPSGLITPIADCEAIADKIIQLIDSPELWDRLSLAGVERVRSFYDELELISRYDVLYREHIAGVAKVSGLEAGVLPWQG